MTAAALATIRRRRDRLATGTPTSTRTATRLSAGSCDCGDNGGRDIRRQLYRRKWKSHTSKVFCRRCGTVTVELWGRGGLLAERRARVDPAELRAHLDKDASSRSSSTRSVNVFNSRNHVAGCDCSAACRRDRVRITYDGRPA